MPDYNRPLLPYTEDFITVQEFEALLEAANDPDASEAIIRKEGSKYVLVSHTGKNLGTFDSRAGAEKREKEIQFFKHTEAGDTYHNRFAPDRKHNKGDKKFKPLTKKCVRCGTTSGQLDINHKDGNRKNNNRSNLNYMCRSCHRKMHAAKNGGRGSVDVAEFTARGSIFEPSDSDRALAGGHKNQDLMHVKFELCHTGVNKNKDGFITSEMQEGHGTAINKPINWEHTVENIGTIYAAEFEEKDGEAVIIVKAAIWKHKHPDRARSIARRFADDDLYFSMETYFQKAQCSICEDEFETSAHYCEHLNTRMQTEGTIRWLKGLNFVGAGCVQNPADVRAKGLAVATKRDKFNSVVKLTDAMDMKFDDKDWIEFVIAKYVSK